MDTGARLRVATRDDDGHNSEESKVKVEGEAEETQPLMGREASDGDNEDLDHEDHCPDAETKCKMRHISVQAAAVIVGIVALVLPNVVLCALTSYLVSTGGGGGHLAEFTDTPHLLLYQIEDTLNNYSTVTNATTTPSEGFNTIVELLTNYSTTGKWNSDYTIGRTLSLLNVDR